MKVLFTLLILLFAVPIWARPGPLIVILLPGTSLQDWKTADAPNLHFLMSRGALAVMNTRTARLPGDKERETPESAVLTLGAGSRAAAPMTDPLSDKASWDAALRANTHLGYDVHLGNLTDALTSAGLQMAASRSGYASWLTEADPGNLSALLVRDKAADCTIIDAGGDIHAADGLVEMSRNQTLVQHGRLIVLSPFASDANYRLGRRLTPVLEYGEDVPAGVLYSPSTRRPGLVTNTDFAPSIAAYFGLTLDSFPTRPYGQPWQVHQSPDALGQVSLLENRAYRQARGMQILPYCAVALAFWILLGTLLAKQSSIFTLVCLSAATALLLAGSAPEAGTWFVALSLAGNLISRRQGEMGAIVIFTAVIVLVLILDMITGSHLMQRSLLGYSAVEGARYYGIGNEAMGLLIGSALVLAVRLWLVGKLHRVILVLAMLTIIALLGSPVAGAKAGGVIVSTAAFGTFLWTMLGRKWSGQGMAIVVMFTVAILGLAAVGDALFFPSHHSHIGEAIKRIQNGGVKEAGDIISRKLSVEFRLAWHSAWASLLWISAGCLWVLNRTSTGQPSSLKLAGTVAVISCLLFNDAGVLAASLCLIPLWADALLRAKNINPQEKISSPRDYSIA